MRRISKQNSHMHHAGPALDIQHSPVRVYLAHAGQPGQAGSDHPAEKQPKSLLKTQENRKGEFITGNRKF